MKKTTGSNWFVSNQQYLMTAVGVVREELKRYRYSLENHAAESKPEDSKFSASQEKLKQAAENMPAPAALDTLCTLFGLSTFERNILILCAAMELDSSFAALCASIQNNPMRPYPTFSLTLAALPGAHWSAITPDAPLRYWRLIEVNTGELLTVSPLSIDERVLHYLAGTPHLDERLAGLVEPLFAEGDLVPSHQNLADCLVRAWSQRTGTSAFPFIQLYGEEVDAKRAVAVAACTKLRLDIKAMTAHTLPAAPGELDALIRLWEREAALSPCVLFLDCDNINTSDAARFNIVNRFIEHIIGMIIISSPGRNFTLRRPMVVFEVNKPTTNEQQIAWKNSLGSEAHKLDGRLEAILSQFNLGTQTIRGVCSEVLGNMTANISENRDSTNNIGDMVWDACRVHTRPRLDNLAQRIKPAAAWDDLVLPAPQKQVLREIAIHMRQRSRVYEEWGFAAKSQRGLGISALFTGESGTGKTMAAEVLANELHLDLYRIDLSQVVSKYIGETEKNLKQVFDAAEIGGAILLFDEADSLFGKRSEVKDSHDRYANIEVSYLLQRMEAYRGLAILTTNMKSALDKAFLRRIRFVVHFPFPDAQHRAEIWQRVFPADTPTENLDVNKLARLNIAGGNIRNIALNAAFLAADKGEPVRMNHLSQAARSEYTKLEKPLSSAEIGEWG
jgi:AAA+ superfamily predicted ATPase